MCNTGLDIREIVVSVVDIDAIKKVLFGDTFVTDQLACQTKTVEISVSKKWTTQSQTSKNYLNPLVSKQTKNSCEGN